MRISFAEWELDAGRRQLLRHGEPVALTPKAFELLWLLISKRPRVVTKEEIHDHLWPATFVSEVNLARLVFELRAALGDDARSPRWLRTARGTGYAFAGLATGAVEPAGPLLASGFCHLILGDREISLCESENVIGRSRDAAVQVSSGTVSRRHARIVVSGPQATLEDLGSRNGTYCRGRRITGPVPLGDGDEVRVGSVLMTFRVFTPDTSTTSVNSKQVRALIERSGRHQR